MIINERSLACASALLIAIALAAVTVACSAGASPSGPQSSQKPLNKTRVVSGNPSISRVPYYIAVSKGFFQVEGLDPESVSLSGGGVDAAKLLAANSVDFAVGQVVDAININKAGVHVLGVGVIVDRSTQGILIRKDLAGSVKSMADVKGNNFVISVSGIGSGQWQFAVYNAELAGVSRDQLNFVANPPANVQAAMQAGRVNVAVASDPQAYQMVADGVAQYLIDMADEGTHQRLVGREYIDDQITV